MKARSRRTFVKNVAAGIAGGALLPSGIHASTDAASQDRVAGANRRVRVALIGCGGQGGVRSAQRLAPRRAVRRALRRGRRAGDEDGGARSRRSSIRRRRSTTRDFRRVLDRQDVDAVIIGTPDHWHALPTIMACQAGKDVYVEKPLALTIGEGRVMVNAARRYNRVVQMGTQQRSSTHFRDAVEYVKSGALGKIRVVKAWAYQDWMGNIAPRRPTASRRRPSTTTCGWARRRSGRSTRTASTSISAGTTTTPAA